MTTITVGELNQKIKSLLEAHFARVWVQGEVSQVTLHTSGHMYFTLKDENSSIRCVMFRANASKLKFRVEVGMSVVVEGAITVYAPKGDYQLLCSVLEPAGQGALAVALEQLKKKLAAKGYFDETSKKKLPKIPKHIALITSKTGAVLQDMLRVAQKRWPLVRLTLINTTVQGDGAALKLSKAVTYADELGCFDIIVIARGGGSVEDLWCFNEEVLADAIFAAHTPIVSAVGHEVDYSISDFTADLRAPTPSACMELVLPDTNDARLALDGYGQRLTEFVNQKIQNSQKIIDNLSQLLKLSSPQAKLAFAKEQLALLAPKIQAGFRAVLLKKQRDLTDCLQALKRESIYAVQWRQNSLDTLKSLLEAGNAHQQNVQGLCMTVKNGKKAALEEFDKGDTIELQSAKAVATAKILKIELLS